MSFEEIYLGMLLFGLACFCLGLAFGRMVYFDRGDRRS